MSLKNPNKTKHRLTGFSVGQEVPLARVIRQDGSVGKDVVVLGVTVHVA